MATPNNFKEVGLNNDNRASSTASSDFDRLEDYFEAEFQGATLSLSQDSEMSPPTSGVASVAGNTSNSPIVANNTDDSANANITRQHSDVAREGGSMNSRRSSTLRPMDNSEIKEFFAVREGAFEKAVEHCRPVVLENLDGEFRGAWLLTEIDHWDTEKERMIFVTDQSVIILKYDFITLRLLDYRRLPLTQFDKVIIGELKYPENSFMPARNQLGVQCLWNSDQPLPMLKRWNPWSREIPWVTYTSHPLLKNDSPQKANYDIEQFSIALEQAIEKNIAKVSSDETPNSVKSCEVLHQPIVIQCYAGIAAALHNANDLGFFKSRGKVSF